MTGEREILLRPHIRGVVIEGLSNAGKTSVLRAIKREQAKDDKSERSVVILGEHYSQALQASAMLFVTIPPKVKRGVQRGSAPLPGV